MEKQRKIDAFTDEALASIDGISRAGARPFLLTRIHARMNRAAESVWDKVGQFIGRPAVVLTSLCLILFINIMIVMLNRHTGTATMEQVSQSAGDEFSYTVATIYEIENAQP